MLEQYPELVFSFIFKTQSDANADANPNLILAYTDMNTSESHKLTFPSDKLRFNELIPDLILRVLRERVKCKFPLTSENVLSYKLYHLTNDRYTYRFGFDECYETLYFHNITVFYEVIIDESIMKKIRTSFKYTKDDILKRYDNSPDKFSISKFSISLKNFIDDGKLNACV